MILNYKPHLRDGVSLITSNYKSDDTSFLTLLANPVTASPTSQSLLPRVSIQSVRQCTTIVRVVEMDGQTDERTAGSVRTLWILNGAVYIIAEREHHHQLGMVAIEVSFYKLHPIETMPSPTDARKRNTVRKCWHFYSLASSAAHYAEQRHPPLPPTTTHPGSTTDYKHTHTNTIKSIVFAEMQAALGDGWS